MRAIFILLFVMLVGINSSFAYELVLPKEKKTVVNTKYVFFIGKACKDEAVYINDERVYIASNGAFAHSTKLKDGENRIVIKSNFSTQVYKVYKMNSNIVVSNQMIALGDTTGAFVFVLPTKR